MSEKVYKILKFIKFLSQALWAFWVSFMSKVEIKTLSEKCIYGQNMESWDSVNSLKLNDARAALREKYIHSFQSHLVCCWKYTMEYILNTVV